MKKSLQVFISYCTADELKKEALKKHLIQLQQSYAERDVELKICEMGTCCADKWDKWMIKSVKASDVVIFILEDSIFQGNKRMLEELRVARDEGKGIVPLILTEQELPDEYKAHIGRLSQVWYTYENGDEETAYKQAVDKAKILLEGFLTGEKVDQGDSVRILSGVAFKNEKFVGRRKEMDWLREKFSQTNVVILQGEGGIGKTSLAENFFYQNPDLFSYAYVITASNGVHDAIRSIDFENTRHIKDADERYRENYRLLSALSEKVVIIFDNCDDEVNTDELSQILNQMKCRFMITSRIGNEDFSEYTLQIKPMETDDLLALTYKHYPNIVKENGGNKTVVEQMLAQFFSAVDGHTMTVEMATAIMRDGDIPVQKIQKAILECNEKCKTRHDKERRTTASDHLAVLYDFANVSDTQENILSAMSLISPLVGIPRKELKELLGIEDTNDINELVAKTFLRMEERVLSMHPLFSDVFYRLKNVAGKKEQNEKVIKYLKNREVDEYDLEENEKKATLLEFLIAKRKDAFEDNFEGKKLLSFVYYRCAWCCDNALKFSQAIEYYLEDIKISKTIYADDPNHPDLASSYNNVGFAYGELGEHKKALEYQLKALEIREIVYADDPNHPDLASSYNNVGYTYGELGEHKKALEYLLKALEIREIIYADDPNHPDLASSYNNVGFAYGELGEHKKALEYKLKALEIREIIYVENPNHPHLAGSYNNVGVTYEELGEYKKAVEYLLKALDIYETIYAEYPNHPGLATSYNNVGGTYGTLGEHQKALEYKLKALEIFEIIYAEYPNHPDLAMSYNNVGVTYEELGEHEKALEYELKALEIWETIYAENSNHPDLALSYNNVGVTYKELGDHKKALEYLLKALEIRKTIYAENPNHPDLALSYGNVAITYEELGDYKNALAYYEKAGKIYRVIGDLDIVEFIEQTIAELKEKLENDGDAD